MTTRTGANGFKINKFLYHKKPLYEISRRYASNNDSTTLVYEQLLKRKTLCETQLAIKSKNPKISKEKQRLATVPAKVFTLVHITLLLMLEIRVQYTKHTAAMIITNLQFKKQNDNKDVKQMMQCSRPKRTRLLES